MNEQPPALYSIEAERSVLGSILIDPPALHEVSDRLAPSHFHIAANRAIYSVLLSLERGNAAVDFVTVAEALSRTDAPSPDGGWEVYLIGLLNTVPTSVNIASYARIVGDYGLRRAMLRAAQQIATKALDTEMPSSDLMSQATELVLAVQRKNDSGQVLAPRHYVRRFLDDLENESPGEVLRTHLVGWNELLLGGLRRPFAHFIAGRPKMGKSALAMQLVGYAAVVLGKRVYMATTEMSDLQFTRRAIAQRTGVPMARLMKRDLDEAQRIRVLEAAGALAENGPALDISAGLTPSQIRARAMRLAGGGGLDLIVVDHLHEMQPDRPGNRRHLELGEMARSLRDTAKTLDVPIVIVAQLNRSVENRGSRIPQLSDFREAGALEETAYSVTFVHREFYYDETKDEKDAQLIVAAHRDGPTGSFQLTWNGPLMRFEEHRPQAQPYVAPGQNGHTRKMAL